MLTYTSDSRFQVLHKEGSYDWILQIKYVQERDAGEYECQVSRLRKDKRVILDDPKANSTCFQITRFQEIGNFNSMNCKNQKKKENQRWHNILSVDSIL